MTTQAQRIAIAEMCGWELTEDSGFCMFQVDDCGYEFDPLNDLNAIHEAEKSLVGEEQNFAYDQEIWRKYGCRATASQRAEEFLRTAGRWDDSL